MATERKVYEYTPYSPSQAVLNAGTKKSQDESAYNKYVTDGYTMSQSVIDAMNANTTANNAYNTHYANGFTFSQADAYKNIMDQILNREKFSYDVNGDALYQQYKDKYITQGKLAMADTMGQAAAMTGGYGNSYAASVGNQAYQASLQQLNDIIPELYQMAYDRYNQEGQDLYNRYGMLSNERATEYGMWTDEGSRLGNDRTYTSNEYNNAYNRDYGQWVNKGTILNNNRTYSSNEYNNAYNRDYAEHTTMEGYNYQDVADANAWAQRQAELDLASSKSTNSGGNTDYAPTLDASEYNDVLINAEAYAAQGETALANYLNGMVARGLSADEAADIYEQYFPSNIPNPPPSTYGSKGGGRVGLTVDMMN